MMSKEEGKLIKERRTPRKNPQPLRRSCFQDEVFEDESSGGQDPDEVKPDFKLHDDPASGEEFNDGLKLSESLHSAGDQTGGNRCDEEEQREESEKPQETKNSSENVVFSENEVKSSSRSSPKESIDQVLDYTECSNKVENDGKNPSDQVHMVQQYHEDEQSTNVSPDISNQLAPGTCTIGKNGSLSIIESPLEKQNQTNPKKTFKTKKHLARRGPVKAIISDVKRKVKPSKQTRVQHGVVCSTLVERARKLTRRVRALKMRTVAQSLRNDLDKQLENSNKRNSVNESQDETIISCENETSEVEGISVPSTLQDHEGLSPVQQEMIDAKSALAGLRRLTQELSDLGKDSATLGVEKKGNETTDQQHSVERGVKIVRTPLKHRVKAVDRKGSHNKILSESARQNPKQLPLGSKQRTTVTTQKVTLSPLTFRYLHRSPPIVKGHSMFKSSPRGPRGSSTPASPGSRKIRTPGTPCAFTPSGRSRKTPTKESVKRRLTETQPKESQPGPSMHCLAPEDIGHQSGFVKKFSRKRRKQEGKSKTKKPRRELAFGEISGEKDNSGDEDTSSDSESDDLEKLTIMTDMETDLDRDLENKSETSDFRLTAINVKNILHQVITNEHVMDMVRNTLQEEGISDQLKEAIFEPKMTRSKVKEVLQKGDITQTLQLPHMWPISPIKVKKKAEPQFMQISFDEDEEDEEYRPGVDDSERDSGDESESVLSSQASDLGSPTPTTPNTPTTPAFRAKFLSDSETTPKTSTEICTPTMAPMGPPPTPRELTRVKNTARFLNQSADNSLCSSSFEEEEEMIALRTRSKIPLVDTPLDEIESKLVAPDITPDLYDPYIDDKEWQEFLTSLTKDKTTELNDTKDDEENDPEYNFLAEVEEVDTEDLRNDRAVRVSRRELNELVDELFLAYACGETADDNSQDVLPPSSPLHVPRPRSTTGTPSRNEDKEKKEKEMKRKDTKEKLGGKGKVSLDEKSDTCDMQESQCEPVAFDSQVEANSESAEIQLNLVAPKQELASEAMKSVVSNSAPKEVQLEGPVALLVVQDLIRERNKLEAVHVDEQQSVNMFHLTDIENIQLEDQMRKHTQLLTQMVVLSSHDSQFQSGRETAKDLLLELKTLGDKANLSDGKTSAFHACNLSWALELLDVTIPTETNEITRIVKRNLGRDGRNNCIFARDLPRLTYEQMRIFCSNKVFIFPQMLPEGGLRPPNSYASAKVVFSYAEDVLVAMGLDQFGHLSNPYDYITRYLLPGKTRNNVAIRVKNLTCKRAEDDNPVKLYKQKKKLPQVERYMELEDPEEIVPPEDRDPELMPWWFAAYEESAQVINGMGPRGKFRRPRKTCSNDISRVKNYSKIKSAQSTGGVTGFSQYIVGPPNKSGNIATRTALPTAASLSPTANIQVLSPSPAGAPVQTVLRPNQSNSVVLIPSASPMQCIFKAGGSTIMTQLPVMPAVTQALMTTQLLRSIPGMPTPSPAKHLTETFSPATSPGQEIMQNRSATPQNSAIPVVCQSSTPLRTIVPGPPPPTFLSPMNTSIGAANCVVNFVANPFPGLVSSVAVTAANKSNTNSVCVKTKSRYSWASTRSKTTNQKKTRDSSLKQNDNQKQSSGKQKKSTELLSPDKSISINANLPGRQDQHGDLSPHSGRRTESGLETAAECSPMFQRGSGSPVIVTSPAELQQFSAQCLIDSVGCTSATSNSIVLPSCRNFSEDEKTNDLPQPLSRECEASRDRWFCSLTIEGGKLKNKDASKYVESDLLCSESSLAESTDLSGLEEYGQFLPDISDDENDQDSSSEFNQSAETVIEKTLSPSSCTLEDTCTTMNTLEKNSEESSSIVLSEVKTIENECHKGDQNKAERPKSKDFAATEELLYVSPCDNIACAEADQDCANSGKTEVPVASGKDEVCMETELIFTTESGSESVSVHEKESSFKQTEDEAMKSNLMSSKQGNPIQSVSQKPESHLSTLDTGKPEVTQQDSAAASDSLKNTQPQSDVADGNCSHVVDNLQTQENCVVSVTEISISALDGLENTQTQSAVSESKCPHIMDNLQNQTLLITGKNLSSSKNDKDIQGQSHPDKISRDTPDSMSDAHLENETLGESLAESNKGGVSIRGSSFVSPKCLTEIPVNESTSPASLNKDVGESLLGDSKKIEYPSHETSKTDTHSPLKETAVSSPKQFPCALNEDNVNANSSITSPVTLGLCSGDATVLSFSSPPTPISSASSSKTTPKPSQPEGIQVRHVTLPVMTPQGTKMITLPVVVGPDGTITEDLKLSPQMSSLPRSPVSGVEMSAQCSFNESPSITMNKPSQNVASLHNVEPHSSPQTKESCSAKILNEQPPDTSTHSVVTTIQNSAVSSEETEQDSLKEMANNLPVSSFSNSTSDTGDLITSESGAGTVTLTTAASPLTKSCELNSSDSSKSQPVTALISPQGTNVLDSFALVTRNSALPTTQSHFSQNDPIALRCSPQTKAGVKSLSWSTTMPSSQGDIENVIDVTSTTGTSLGTVTKQSEAHAVTDPDGPEVSGSCSRSHPADKHAQVCTTTSCSPQGINTLVSGTLAFDKLSENNELSHSDVRDTSDEKGQDVVANLKNVPCSERETVLQPPMNTICDQKSHKLALSNTNTNVLHTNSSSSSNKVHETPLLTVASRQICPVLSPTKMICDMPVSSTSTVTVYCGPLMSTRSSVNVVESSLSTQVSGTDSILVTKADDAVGSCMKNLPNKICITSRESMIVPHTAQQQHEPLRNPDSHLEPVCTGSMVLDAEDGAPHNPVNCAESGNVSNTSYRNSSPHGSNSTNLCQSMPDFSDNSCEATQASVRLTDTVLAGTELATPVKNLQLEEVVISPGYGSPLTPQATPTKGIVDTPTKSAVEIMAAIAKFMTGTPTKTPVKVGPSPNSPLKTPKSRETLLGIPRKRAAVPMMQLSTPVKYRSIGPMPGQSTSPTKLYSPLKPHKSPRRQLLKERARVIAPKGLVITSSISPTKMAAESLKAKARKLRTRPILPKQDQDVTKLAQPLKRKIPMKQKRIATRHQPRQIFPKLDNIWAMDQGTQDVDVFETVDSETVDGNFVTDYDSLDSESASDDNQSPDENGREGISGEKLTKLKKQKMKKHRKRPRLEAKEENDSGSEEDCGHQMAPAESQDEGDLDDDQDHLAALMAASTTIEFASKSGKTLMDARDARKKSKQKRKRDLTLQMLDPNLMDTDPQRDERETAFAQSFLAKVKDRLQGNKGKYEDFLRLLWEFNKSKNTPTQLYWDMCNVLADYPDLTVDFAGFLLPDQAQECGCLLDNIQFHRARTFLRKLEIHFKKHPSHLQKVLKAMGDWQSKAGQDHRSLKENVLPLLREHEHLMEEFLLFFEEERPPESYLHGFEEVTLGDSDEDKMTLFDGFEEVELPEGDEKYNGTLRCCCPCHIHRHKKRKKHCDKCALVIIDGKLFLQYTVGTKNKLRPVQVVYSRPLSPNTRTATCNIDDDPVDQALEEGDSNEGVCIIPDYDLPVEKQPRKKRKKRTKKLKLEPSRKCGAGKFVNLDAVADTVEDSGSQSREDMDTASCIPPGNEDSWNSSEEKSQCGKPCMSSSQPTDFSGLRKEIRRAQEKLAVKTVEFERLNSASGSTKGNLYEKGDEEGNTIDGRNQLHSIESAHRTEQGGKDCAKRNIGSSAVEETSPVDADNFMNPDHQKCTTSEKLLSSSSVVGVDLPVSPKSEFILALPVSSQNQLTVKPESLNSLAGHGTDGSDQSAAVRDCGNSHLSQDVLYSDTTNQLSSDKSCSSVHQTDVLEDDNDACVSDHPRSSSDVDQSTVDDLKSETEGDTSFELGDSMAGDSMLDRQGGREDGKKERIILRINLSENTAQPVLCSPAQSKDSSEQSLEDNADGYSSEPVEILAPWTREEDKMILETCKIKGSKPETFQVIADQLQCRTVEQVQQRLAQLLQLLVQDSSDLDSSGESGDET